MSRTLHHESFGLQLRRGLGYALCFNAVLLTMLMLCLLTTQPLRWAGGVSGFFIGAAGGDFLNHLYYRLTRGMPVLAPANHCPCCFATIRAVYNVPVAGWLLVRGRCVSCGVKIPLRYLLSGLCGGVIMCVIGIHVMSLGGQ